MKAVILHANHVRDQVFPNVKPAMKAKISKMEGAQMSA
jgi:hypothetical protein